MRKGRFIPRVLRPLTTDEIDAAVADAKARLTVGTIFTLSGINKFYEGKIFKITSVYDIGLASYDETERDGKIAYGWNWRGIAAWMVGDALAILSTPEPTSATKPKRRRQSRKANAG